MDKMELNKLYADGKYGDMIGNLQLSRMQEGTNINIDILLNNAYIKANMLNLAVLHSLEMQSVMFAIDNEQVQFLAYYNYLKYTDLLRASYKILNDLSHISINSLPNLELLEQFIGQDVIVFPIIWSVAFGDSIVLCQFIKKYAMDFPTKKILVITSLNRPDLKGIYEMLEGVATVIDICLLEEEKDRQKSLFLLNGYVLNVAVQEKMIIGYLDILETKASTVQIIKTRYLPILMGFEADGYFRIWEKRAELFLNNGYELPKLADDSNIEKSNSIVVHFRDGNYSDLARNINKHYAQDLINAIRSEYPDYEVIRLGDENMPVLANCRNASHENLTVADQVAIIQKAKLAICCHSSVQHLVVACSDTPLICINYLCQETTTSMDDNIARMSYEPVGKQVKKIFYIKAFDAEGKELIPRQNDKNRASFTVQEIEDVILEVQKWLD